MAISHVRLIDVRLSSDHLTSDLKPRLPKIPRRMDVFVTPEQLESRRVRRRARYFTWFTIGLICAFSFGS